MIVYRELSSLERDLGISAKTLYAVSNIISKHYHKAKLFVLYRSSLKAIPEIFSHNHLTLTRRHSL